MKNTTILLAAFLLLNISCEEIVDRAINNDEEITFNNAYRGQWVGTYTGSLSGNLNVNIDKNGYAEVSRTAVNANETYSTSIIGSSFNSISHAPSGFILYGNLEQKSGTWKMGSLEGNWVLVKK